MRHDIFKSLVAKGERMAIELVVRRGKGCRKSRRCLFPLEHWYFEPFAPCSLTTARMQEVSNSFKPTQLSDRHATTHDTRHTSQVLFVHSRGNLTLSLAVVCLGGKQQLAVKFGMSLPRKPPFSTPRLIIHVWPCNKKHLLQFPSGNVNYCYKTDTVAATHSRKT